jgi:ATP-binding cassette subfamily B protein
MKILWNYIKPQKWIIILSMALAVISHLLSLVDPVIFGKIIDDYPARPVWTAD